MLPTKKPSLSPATQVLATSFKPTVYNLASQTPANASFKLTDPYPPPSKHPQHPPLAPTNLSLKNALNNSLASLKSSKDSICFWISAIRASWSS